MVGEGERMPNSRAGLRSESGHVISKAEGKCDEILKQVSQKDPDGVIFKEAELLQEKGKTLLDAATEAKRLVESKVGEALQAVVAMDGDLKRDLKTVRDKIRKGIKDVIDTLQVTKLDGLVKNDLGDLRQSIMDLQKKVKDKGDENDNIVAQQFKDLQSAKTQLEVVTGKDKGSIHQAVEDLDNKFSSEIHSPLSNAVGEVDMAIGKLGEKFQLTDGKKEKLGEIFGILKKRLGRLRQEGRGWKNTGASGLEGIVTGLVNSYANGFTGWEFNKSDRMVGKQSCRITAC
ncbi:Extracellular matrix-binding ebh, putative [Babesia ovata]|uniref:Extracellular matrix-binding ebh, putative n=1 Tax=Babesia ovata TaxID=189622 RepID=A0A2H6KAP5_9APIC|nr:Extracellular matrix-binding ebh, putative [Babesia ovata]GBE60060.1 Extracellular matrix-binding ebh, putative [Babesia ovata]